MFNGIRLEYLTCYEEEPPRANPTSQAKRQVARARRCGELTTVDPTQAVKFLGVCNEFSGSVRQIRHWQNERACALSIYCDFRVVM